MKTITVKASGTYDVMIGNGLLPRVGQLAAKLLPGRNAAVLSDSNVAPLYLPVLENSLREAGFRVCSLVLPAGEETKCPEKLTEALEFLASERLTRSDAVFALGGGVTGDLAGLAAAVYLRGIRYVQIPTSLLAMVDSSVGGKTAIDLRAGKNLAGAFWQPSAVFCDPDALRTLPEAFFTDGSAEVVKYAILRGEPLTDLLEDGIRTHPEEVISRCIDIKRELVEKDEFDRGERMFLNLGHTVGHAVERCSGYAVSHGRAVAIGISAAARLSLLLGLCAEDLPERIDALLLRHGLPVRSDLPAEALCGAMLSDKKRESDGIRFILPREIGRCVSCDIGVGDLPSLLREALR